MVLVEPHGRSFVRIAWIAFAVGVFVATDAAAIRSWLLLTIAGCLPPAVMFVHSHTLARKVNDAQSDR